MPTICRNVQETIREDIWEPVEQWLKRTEDKCEENSWWNPIRWFCWVITVFDKIIVPVLRTVVTVVFRVVCEVINFLANAVATVVNAVLALPIIGPAIRAVINFVVTLVSEAVGLLDGLGRLIGIRITKHLRVHVIPLCEGDVPLASQVHLEAIMRETERIFYARAQIRLHTTFHEPVRNPPEDALRLGTEADLILDELWAKGTWHQMQTVKIFESNLWSLIGVGHPIIVYVVREVGYDGQEGVVGASAGPFTNWIAVERNSVVPLGVADANMNLVTPFAPFPPTVASSAVNSAPNSKYKQRVIAHEICHALGLLGHGNASPGELMVESDITGDALSPLQVGIIRNSSAVTFV